MNALTDPLKRIARDLVDKTLWPFALLLLAAIVAVPMLISGPSSAPAPAPAPVATLAPTSPRANALVTAVDPTTDTRKQTRRGRVTDPFYDPPAPPAAASQSGARTSGASVADADEPSSGGGGGGGGGGGATAGDTSSRPTPRLTPPRRPTPRPTTGPVAAPAYHRTEVRWYESTAGAPRPLARLAPLGSLADPAALYLGVTKSSGFYAVFLLGLNAVSNGDAECEGGTDCRVIGLKAGQAQNITLQPPAGEARRYRLEVVAVKAVTTDAATARTMRARVHADGRDVMRAMWRHPATAEALRPIGYDRDSGLLVQTVGDKVTG